MDFENQSNQANTLDEIKSGIFEHLDELERDLISSNKEIEDHGRLTFLGSFGDKQTNMLNNKLHIEVQIKYLEDILEFIDTDFRVLTDTAKAEILLELSKLSEMDISREDQRVKMREMDTIRKTIDDIVKMEIGLLKDGIFEHNIDDLMAKSLFYRNRGTSPTRASDREINDIFAKAYLDVKDSKWREGFKLSNFKEEGTYSLDGTREDLYEMISRASKNMDDNTLLYFHHGEITVHLNGEKITMSGEEYTHGTDVDERYEDIFNSERDRRKGGSIAQEPTEREFINYNIEDEEIVKVASLGFSMSDIGFTNEEITELPIVNKIEEIENEEITHLPESNEALNHTQLIAEAADFIMSFEDFSKTPYWDHGQWSWGYGTKVPGSTNNENKNPGGTITKEQAKVLKYAHIEADYKKVNQYFWFEPMTKNQKIAILSFVYNNGRDIFEVKKGARNLQKVFFDPKSSIDEKIKAMMPFHYASGEPLEGLKRRRAGEAILARKKEEGEREQIDMMVMADNEKPGETVSVIYGKDTLGRTITRAIDRINKNSNESDSSTLATRLAEFNPDFNTIHSGDKVYTKKKQFNSIDYYEITFKGGKFIVRGEDVYGINTPLDQVIIEKKKEITESKKSSDYTVLEKDTLGKILEKFFPNIYNQSNPGWKTKIDYSPLPSDKLFINGTTLRVERGTQEFIFEVK